MPRDSAAYDSGLQVGDLIAKANDQPVNNVTNLKNILDAAEKGKDVRLTVFRGDDKEGRTITIVPPTPPPSK